MKECPIIFSGPMVRAILAGQKTQTRRVVKVRGGSDPVVVDGKVWKPARVDYSGYIQCPYGFPGDRLWVREAWCEPFYLTHDIDCEQVGYRADNPESINGQVIKWKPSIFMPRWASRITLSVVSVRVERLQDITIDDVIAEGVFADFDPPDGHGFRSEARNLYEKLWESINGPGSWDANPWVWVIEFERRDK
jgi:hypothetical protein